MNPIISRQQMGPVGQFAPDTGVAARLLKMNPPTPAARVATQTDRVALNPQILAASVAEAPAAGKATSLAEKVKQVAISTAKWTAITVGGAVAFGLPAMIAVTHPVAGQLVGMVTIGLATRLAVPIPGASMAGLVFGPLVGMAGAAFGGAGAIGLGVLGAFVGSGAALDPHIGKAP